ncbi:SufS family cysteine desulfurase [Aureliella helgolandensis]|uniref:cysteine desulfurase n=1 Tax=Aureliella helgolandensis TaxID=2527968 RepID=A0A518G6T3_9BACT|nr:SufS family cysteine desulfurase [Aureliella helgolandensis]QDV24294.1 Cysteine desulfurase [Aureliella helgolandensis]
MNSEFANKIRSDFPILATQMSGKPLVYLDNGATTQKPQAMIDALVHYYTHDNANIHRGVYELSQRATDAYELARKKVAAFLGVEDAAECVFVRGTTDGINLVAASWGGNNLKAGDEVLVSGLEHHSNIVPWQLICERAGASLRVWQPNAAGELDLQQLPEILSARTKMVAIQHVSNALGTIHDVAEIVRCAKAVDATVLVDGAQWVGHYATNVAELGCDFYTFSGHKLYGPTGIGVLWGRRELLEAMPPYQGGGDMIETVEFSKSTYAPLPNLFEAGTPNIAGAIGLGAAIDYVQEVGFERISAYEDALLEYATEKMTSVPGLRILGTAARKAAVISFVLESPSIAPLDIATTLSDEGIAIRTGHHCCMPLMGELKVSGTSRVSLAMYNTFEEVDRLVEVLNALVSRRASKQATAADDSNSSSELSAAISFAAAVAESPEAAAHELAEEFLLFDDRESKTELLLELGQELPDCFEALKVISTAVPGCMSEVYLVGRPATDKPDYFEFSADSNAEIVRGLIAVLIKLFSGQKAEQILAFDIESFFRRIGFDQFVSTQRRSGLDGMIRRIRTLAQSIADRDASATAPS